VLTAWFRSRSNASGWTASDAVLYFATSESLLLAIGIFPDWNYNLGERVRTGEIISDLVRPVTLVWRELAERFGMAGYYLLTRTPAVFGAGWLVYGLLPPLRWELALFPLSLALAIGVCAALFFISCSGAFWHERANGEISAVLFLTTFFGGVFVPLDFLPPALRWAANALPFRAAAYTPIAIFSGRLSGAELWLGLLHQVVWLGLLLATGRALELRGLRRIAAQGG